LGLWPGLQSAISNILERGPFVSREALDLIAKIGEKEASLTEMTFVSPIFDNTVVATRVAGIIYTFEIPKTKPGWYEIKPTGVNKAKIKGEADCIKVDQYLHKLSKIRIVIALKKDNIFYGIVEKNNNFGLDPCALVPVMLHDDMVLEFDKVVGRFDGAGVWFHGLDHGNDPAKAEYLRESMLKLVDPKKIKFSGLNFEEKAAYACRLELDKKLVEDRKKVALQTQVEHAGGKLVKFVERQDHLSVTYSVDGEQYTSYVSKDQTHRIITAGICLQGSDPKFDLASLVTVVREGQHKNLIHRFNNTRG
jgi:hypothetical protein